MAFESNFGQKVTNKKALKAKKKVRDGVRTLS